MTWSGISRGTVGLGWADLPPTAGALQYVFTAGIQWCAGVASARADLALNRAFAEEGPSTCRAVTRVAKW